jgi:hypothetical protein
MEPEKTRIVISLIVVMGFYVLIGMWFVLPLKGDPGVFNLLAGAAIAGFSSVLGYYVGSSSGSKAKDATVGNIATSAVPAATPAVSPAAPVGTTRPTVLTGDRA